MKKGFLETLKEKKYEKEIELEIINQAIEIVEKDNNWEIIMLAKSII